MTSQVSIINAALRRLGQETISAVDEGSRAANLAGPTYDEQLLLLLQRHHWNWAIRRIQLAKAAHTPVSGFANIFPAPSDLVRVIVVSSTDSGYSDLRYRLEGDALSGWSILTDSESLFLEYVAHITDPLQMSPNFQYVLSRGVARELAIALTGSRALHADLAEEYERALTSAVAIDAIENWPDSRPEGSWVRARFGLLG